MDLMIRRLFATRAALFLAAAFALTPNIEAQAATCMRHSDFLVRSDPSLAPVRPADCSTITQSPPEFTWPPQSGDPTYVVTITGPGGRNLTQKTQKNWLLLDRALPPGNYTWRVAVEGNKDARSEPRTFNIAADAVPFVVPAPAALFDRAKSTPRPRTWSADPTRPLGAARAERAGGFMKMVREVDAKMANPVQPEPKSTSVGANYDETVAEQKRAIASSLAWAVTRQQRYGADAARRLMALAEWNVDGTLSYKANDMGSRNVAWAMALGYDWLHDYLEDGQKRILREAIRARVQPMFEDMSRLSGYPYDSHGNVTLTLVAAIGVLMAGELPEAERWVKEGVPLAVVWTSPWGANDGGFANGTQQMFWDTGENLPAWNILRNAAGVDLAAKDWVRNHARFLAYFSPPGAPSGVFGDGHEMKLDDVRARVARALAQFAPTQIGSWYASSARTQDEGRFELLLAPRRDTGGASLPAGTPDAAYFPSVGWVAMHSKLADPMRTSVYFKSSPYGSYNHSHADQNSFVIHSQGRRLLSNSGVYDGYQTPHWREWYKQTKATNAITFDGGQGQGFNGKQFAGEITRFATYPTHDYAVGRAEAAYGGALKKALRSVIYLKPDVVIVYDSLASDTPRTWEWNFHTPGTLSERGPSRIFVRNGPASACIERIAGPMSRFVATEGYAVPPRDGGRAERESHGAFVTEQKSTEAEFVTMIRIGSNCAGEDDTLQARMAPRDGERMQLAGRSVNVAGDEVVVR
jgi:hypothetical protein